MLRGNYGLAATGSDLAYFTRFPASLLISEPSILVFLEFVKSLHNRICPDFRCGTGGGLAWPGLGDTPFVVINGHDLLVTIVLIYAVLCTLGDFRYIQGGAPTIRLFSKSFDNAN